MDCKLFRCEYRQRTVEHKVKYCREWARKNPEKIKTYAQKWKSSNPDKRREIVNNWRSMNPDLVKAMNRRAGKKWAANNKGHRNFITKTRVAAVKLRTPYWADLEKIRIVYEESARVTGESGMRHEVDHIIPLQGETVSGLHVHYNLQILTITKNRSKGNELCVF